MKIIFFLLLILNGIPFSSANPHHTALRRSNGLLRFIVNSPLLRTYALESIINTRCHRYLLQNDRAACKKAVKRQLQLLDYDILLDNRRTVGPNGLWDPQSFVFVAFKKNLITLLSDAKTTLYLLELQKRLNDYLLTRNPDLNLWEVTLKHFKTKDKAALVLAALFQDTSSFKLHLAYLDRARYQSGGQTSRHNLAQNRELLSQTIDTINQILDYSEDNFRDLFYPRSIGKSLNRSIYHFYVPLYLSMQLKVEGHTQAAAYHAPLMMTLSYEFLTYANDTRYVFKDPERIDAFDLVKLQDIYGGHAGAIFGVRNSQLSSFDLMRENFSRSTSEGVELLLKQ